VYLEQNHPIHFAGRVTNSNLLATRKGNDAPAASIFLKLILLSAHLAAEAFIYSWCVCKLLVLTKNQKDVCHKWDAEN